MRNFIKKYGIINNFKIDKINNWKIKLILYIYIQLQQQISMATNINIATNITNQECPIKIIPSTTTTNHE
jgi:hypothetical protein